MQEAPLMLYEGAKGATEVGRPQGTLLAKDTGHGITGDVPERPPGSPLRWTDLARHFVVAS